MASLARAPFALVAVLLFVPRGSAVAADCHTRVFEDIEAQGEQLRREAQQIPATFLAQDVTSAAWGAYKRRLDELDGADPLSSAWKGYREAEEYRSKLQDWSDRVSRWRDGFASFRSCLNSDDCRIDDWLRESEVLNRELADWLRSLGDGGFQAATERVERAAGLLDDYTRKVGERSWGNVNNALLCLAQQAQAPPPSPPEPVRLGPPPQPKREPPKPPKPPPPAKPKKTPEPKEPEESPSSGPSAAPLLIGTGVGVGTLLALRMLPPDESSGESSSSGCKGITRPSANPLTACSGGNARSTACQAAIAQWDQYCKCNNFSGFDTSYGSCR